MSITAPIERAEFADRGTPLVDPEIAQGATDHLDEMAKGGEIDPQSVERKDIGAQLQARVENDYPSLAKEYAFIPDSNGGQILNTDLARELSPAYRQDRTRSADVHEAASSFVKKLYAEKLAAPTPAGKDSLVLFTAGGTGAGKSTGLKLFPKLADSAEIIYDANLNRFDSADSKIQQALNAGRDVQIIYTYADPLKAFAQAIGRSEGMKKKLGSGRTVPIGEHVKTHVGSSETVRQLAEKYRDDPRVGVNVVDNTGNKGAARPSSLEKLPKINDNGLRQRILEALNEARSAGKISDATYAGFKNGERADPTQWNDSLGVRQGVDAGVRGQPEPQRSERRFDVLTEVPAAEGSASASELETLARLDNGQPLINVRDNYGIYKAGKQYLISPFKGEGQSATTDADGVLRFIRGNEEHAAKKFSELFAARQAVAETPDALIAYGFDETGAPQYRNASEALAEIEAEHQEATKDGTAFWAAETNARYGKYLRRCIRRDYKTPQKSSD